MAQFPLEYQTTARPHSRAGIASVVLGILSLVGLFISLIQVHPRGFDAKLFVVLQWVITAVSLISPVIGLVLGIVGLRSRDRKRVLAVVGVCVNGGLLVLLTVVIVAFA